MKENVNLPVVDPIVCFSDQIYAIDSKSLSFLQKAYTLSDEQYETSLSK